MAREAGLSQTAVSRIWRAFGLQPHRQETFKLSSDPLFVEKVRDIVGLYMDPPLKAMVLCVDEKSQIQALDPDGHPKLLHCWPVKLLQAGRSDYAGSGGMARRAAASLSR